MVTARSLLSRVRRLEQAGAPVRSPFQRWYGSLGAFETEVQSGIDVGIYDQRDMPVVLAAIRVWHEQALYGAWQRQSVLEFGR